MRAFGLLASVFAFVLVACGGDDSSSGGSSPSGGDGGTGSVPPGTSTNTGGTKGVAGESPLLSDCQLFPADNPWNLDISASPLSPKSATYIAKMAPGTKPHPDWGTVTEGYGFPINVGKGATPVPITFTTSWGPKESDPLPCSGGQFCYPIPAGAKIEAPSDSHLLYLDTTGAPQNCTLYELYTAAPSGSSYSASNGAIFHLGSNALRPDGWTSGDAAGLPILPGLVRFDEVKAGAIKHAIRFTMDSTQQGYIHPATHAAGNSDVDLPPMGLRVRLKASVNVSAPAEGMVVIAALKKYGAILADNGSNWYLSGDQNEGWKDAIDNVKKALDQIHGSDFEVVDTGAVSTANLD